MKGYTGLAIGLLLLSGLISQAQATLITSTDASWRVTAGGPAGSWNTDVAFDDSGWELATELYSVQTYHPDYDPATKGIWSSGGQYSTLETEIWVRNVFTLTDLPLTAFLHGAFDDDGEIYINGNLVLVDNDDQATDLSIGDITPYLVMGDNLISYHALDEYRIWGYNHASYVEVVGTFAEKVPEPATLFLLGAGLLGLSLNRKRQ